MLLNKHNLGIARLAPKETTRLVLSSVRITPEYTAVTDGHYLLKVTLPPETSASMFPEMDTPALDKWKPFNLSAKSALKALAAMPKSHEVTGLTMAAVVKDGDVTKLTTTDLQNTLSLGADAKSNFPDIENVIPSGDGSFQIMLNADLLSKIMSQFAEFKKHDSGVRFTFTNNLSAVRMDAEVDGQKMTAVLMPMRS